jgi:hypothetical protein
MVKIPIKDEISDQRMLIDAAGFYVRKKIVHAGPNRQREKPS